MRVFLFLTKIERIFMLIWMGNVWRKKGFSLFVSMKVDINRLYFNVHEIVYNRENNKRG